MENARFLRLLVPDPLVPVADAASIRIDANMVGHDSCRPRLASAMISVTRDTFRSGGWRVELVDFAPKRMFIHSITSLCNSIVRMTSKTFAVLLPVQMAGLNDSFTVVIAF